MNLKQRLATLRDGLLTGLVERDVAIRLGLLAAVSGEHLLLIGPPGTGKSLVARRLRDAFADATYFERLLTRFSVPEELFGPLSVKGLEDDRYLRQTRGYLPEAAVAFLDEIFKANSAILNALLTLLNERAFDNDGTRHTTPLITLVGASNELPNHQELGALYDRFLLRLFVAPISTSSVDALLDLDPQAYTPPPSQKRLTADELAAVQLEASGIALDPELRDLLKELRLWLAERGLPFSDRRLRKLVQLLQVMAWTDGRDVASVWDAWVVQHVVWDVPDDHESIAAWWRARVGTLKATNPSRLLDMVSAWEAELTRIQSEEEQARDASGSLLYVQPDGSLTPNATHNVQATTNLGKPLFLAPPVDSYGLERTNRCKPDGRGYTVDELDDLDLQDADGSGMFFRAWSGREDYLAAPHNQLVSRTELPPAMAPKRFSDAHIQGWTSQLDELHETITVYLAGVARRKEDTHTLRDHTWVPQSEFEGAKETLESSQRVATDLLHRITAVSTAIAALERE